MTPARGRALLLSLALLSGDCGGAGPGGTPGRLVDYLDDPAYPQDFWPISTCEAEGLDEARLVDGAAWLEAQRLDVVSFLVVRNGRIVFERYGYDADVFDPSPFGDGPHQVTPDELRHLYSTTKSVTSALVGLAIAEGRIAGVDSSVLSFFPGRTIQHLDDAKRQLTIDDVLTMRSGLAWAEGVDNQAQEAAADPVQYVLDLPMSEAPGTRFNYCTGCSHLLTAILQQAVGESAEAYAVEKLFGPTGIRHHRWWADPRGVTVGGWGLSLTSRDLAKLGLLYLRHGRWDGAQVLPEGWVEASTAARVTAYGDVRYGYQWWSYPDLGAFGTRGAFGQDLFVLPAQDLIVAFTADLAHDTAHEVLAGIVRDYVLPALQR